MTVVRCNAIIRTDCYIPERVYVRDPNAFFSTTCVEIERDMPVRGFVIDGFWHEDVDEHHIPGPTDFVPDEHMWDAWHRDGIGEGPRGTAITREDAYNEPKPLVLPPDWNVNFDRSTPPPIHSQYEPIIDSEGFCIGQECIHQSTYVPSTTNRGELSVNDAQLSGIAAWNVSTD